MYSTSRRKKKKVKNLKKGKIHNNLILPPSAYLANIHNKTSFTQNIPTVTKDSSSSLLTDHFTFQLKPHKQSISENK